LAILFYFQKSKRGKLRFWKGASCKKPSYCHPPTCPLPFYIFWGNGLLGLAI